MNKITAVLFIIILILAMPMTAFASVPQKKANVTDTAHIFPDARINEINLTAQQQDSDITFYILTVDTLNGENSVEFAAEVYNTWGLKVNDTLILISKEDHRIEVNYTNVAYLSNLNLPDDYDNGGESSETNLEKLIGKHFIPYAKKEDYASGVIDFMNTFRNLNTIKSTRASTTESNSPNEGEEEKDSSRAILAPLYIIGSIVGVTVICAIGLIIRELGGGFVSIGNLRRAERIATQEIPQTTRTQSQQPTTVADALENILNNNGSTVSDPPETRRNTNTNDNVLDSTHSNSGFRVIRVNDDKQTQENNVDKHEAKRIIR